MEHTMTFEQASAQLDDILSELSNEVTPLDRSLALYAEAAKLIAFCGETLEKARITVEEIDARFRQPQT